MISPANHHDSIKLIDVVENISDFVDDGIRRNCISLCRQGLCLEWNH